MLDQKSILIHVLCAGACAWYSLTLVLVSGGTLGSAAVANRCDHRRSFTLGGGGGSNLGGGTLLCIGGSTLRGGAGLWSGGCSGGLCVWSSYCPHVSCISCVITFGDCRGSGLLVGCVGCGGGAVRLKIYRRRSNYRMDDSWGCGGNLPLRADAIFVAADIMAYLGVDLGLDIYFYLKNSFPDIIGLLDFFTHSYQQRYYSGEVPRTYYLKQCGANVCQSLVFSWIMDYISSGTKGLAL